MAYEPQYVDWGGGGYTVIMWIEDLRLPGKPRIYMGNSGYASVQEMQDELIRRRPNLWADPDAYRFYSTEAIDRIENGVDIWKWNWGFERWERIQRITLEKKQ